MRIGLISDIHSNYVSLQTTLDFLKGKIDVLLCSGDFVGYGPSPKECIEALIDFPLPNYYCLGNHDLGVRYQYSCNTNNPLEKDAKILSKFRFSEEAEEMIKRNASELKDIHFNFLRNLPFKQIFQLKGYKIYLTHGTPSVRRAENVGKYLFPPPRLTNEVIINRISKDKYAKKSDLIIVGHSHQRFLIDRSRLSHWSLINDILDKKQTKFPLTFSTKRRKVILNPGSVGQARDGTGNASFTIINIDKQEIVFHDLNYPRRKFYQLVKKKCDSGIHGDNFWENRFGNFSKKQ